MKIETTREELISVFTKWNESVVDKPNDFDEIEKGKSFAEDQTDELIKRIKDEKEI